MELANNAIVVLLVLALGVFVLEAFIPGTTIFVWIGGGLLVLASLIAGGTHGAEVGWFAFVGSITCTAGLLYLEFKVLKALGHRIALQGAVEGDTRPQVMGGAAALIGQTAEVVSQLRPVGRVRIAGQFHEARSVDGLIEPGTPVRVVAVESDRLLVRRA